MVAAGKSPKQGWVTQSRIDQQVTVLNMTYAGFYGGDNTGFKFRLAAADWTTNTAWYNQATFDDEVAMKSALKRGGPTDLNIYSTSGGGYLGWAYLNSTIQVAKYAVLDGVVLHSGSLPGGYVKNYNLGYTATHEVGHWLGLEHTFEQGCIGAGDYVDDTPAEPKAHERVPGGQGHLHRPGTRSDPQLHGLLVRQLLHAVHRGAVGPYAGAVAPLARRARLDRRPEGRRATGRPGRPVALPR